MKTKIAVYADRIIEAGWLLAALSVPLFFNVYSSRTFEPDKLTLLRSIALVMAAAWLVKTIDGSPGKPPGESWGQWLRRLVVQTPLVLPTLLLIVTLLLSTLLSVAPRQSFFGSYQRLQGTYTTLSYITIFFMMLQGLQRREQIERLVTLAIIVSLPVTLYGVLQNLGRDPLPWLGDVTRRIASTMGNSIFVAAYLIMIVPLTLGRLLRTVTATIESANPPTANFVLIPFYVLILVSQLAAIAFTQSRGPWLGLFGGLFFFVLLWTLGFKKRWPTLAWLGVSLAGFALLIVLNLPNSPLASLRSVPYVERLARILVENPTGEVRTLIWRGAAELVTSDPLRFLIGYGPETMHVAYNPYYPPELGQIENRNASPDRSHNETWDSLATTGALGFAAYMALFTSMFLLGLKWLGLLTSPRQRNLFLALWFGVGLMVAAGFVALMEPGFFGVALPAGMMLGLFIYLMWFAFTRQTVDEAARANPYRFLLVALYAAMIAHFIEIHFGIAIAATRTYFWQFLALLVAAGALWQTRSGLAVETPVQAEREAVRQADKVSPVETRRTRKTSPPSSRRPVSPLISNPQSLVSGPFSRELLALSLLVGVMLVVMIFDFYAPAAGINFNWYMWWLFTFSWVFAAPIVLAERAAPPRSAGEWAKSLAVFAGVSLGWPLPYLLVHNATFSQPTAEAVAFVTVPLYLYLALSALVLAYSLLRGEPLPQRWIADARAIVYPALAIFIAALVLVSNVRVVSADILYKQAWVNYHQRRQYDPALTLYDRALNEQPSQDFYLLFKGKALMEKAQTTSDPAAREQVFIETRRVLEQARALSPLNTDHTANLARMYQTWANATRPGSERDQRLAKSLEYYEEALALSPNNALIWNQYSSAYLDSGQPQKALETLQHSLAVDSRFHDTYLRLMETYAELGQMDQVLEAYNKAVEIQPRFLEPHLILGDIYRRREMLPQAAEAYQRAVNLNPRSAEGRSALALVLAQSGQRDRAIQENLEVLKLAPNDVSTHKNLALLYREAGNTRDALTYARKALELSPRDTALQDFVKQLEAQK